MSVCPAVDPVTRLGCAMNEGHWGEHAATRSWSVSDEAPRSLLLRVEDAAAQLGLSRSKVYDLIGHGDIETVRIGSSVRIPHDALLHFVDSLRKETAPA